MHIYNYLEYLNMLKKSFGDVKKMPTDEDIYEFIKKYNLESDWNVEIEDVKKDINQSILVKYRTKAKKQFIRSYDEYLVKLKEEFGIPESMPKDIDIKSFINEYNLEKIYGITTEEVTKDLNGFIEGKYDEMYEEALSLKHEKNSKPDHRSVYRPIILAPKRRTVSQYYSQSYRSYYTPPIQIQQPASKSKSKSDYNQHGKDKKKIRNIKQENELQETYLLDGDNHINEGVKGIEHTTKDKIVKAFFSQPGAKRRFDKKFAKRPNVSSELVEPGDQAVDKRIKKETEIITRKKNQKVTIVSQDKGFQKVQCKKKNGSSIFTAKSVKEKKKK